MFGSATSKLLSSMLLLLAAQNAFSFAPSPTIHRSIATKSSRMQQQQLSAIDPSAFAGIDLHVPSVTTTSAIDTSSMLTSLSPILSNENISKAFNVATFGPQILWLFMILLPNTTITKKLMGTQIPVIAFSLVHLFIVIASASQEDGTAPLVEFNDVFDPSGDPQAAMINMMRYPNFVSEEWSHVLTWDLFVGRMVWLDGLKRGIFTSHSVLFCNLIGPPGYLMHCATCLLTGKGIVGNEAPEEKDDK